MQLAILHPEVAYRDCATCLEFVHDEKTGELQKYRGEPVRRAKGTFPPCRYPDPATGKSRCPNGTPEASKRLTPKNFQAWEHYLECKATGLFPDDPIVRRNAGLIRRIEDSLQDQTRRLLMLMLETK